jgi:hypothetical protein
MASEGLPAASPYLEEVRGYIEDRLCGFLEKP